VNLFLTASVVLAACGRPAGASGVIFELASRNWTLMTSPYVVSEVTRNLPRLPAQAVPDWTQLRAALAALRDIWTIDREAKAKDPTAGFSRKSPSGFVAPQSKIHQGYGLPKPCQTNAPNEAERCRAPQYPSARLAIRPFARPQRSV
jgi:hypothetical protein